MSTYSDLTSVPAFDAGVMGDPDDPHPVDILVRSRLHDLRGGIDGFFDTITKVENGDLSGDIVGKAVETCLTQIETARSELAGCGVTLPCEGMNVTSTTPRERLYEVGRWVYQFFEADYHWHRPLATH